MRRKPVKDFNDIINLEVGYLTVKEYLYSEANKNGIGNHHYYNCTCKCGNEHIVKRKSLLKTEVKSCGCLSKENAKVQSSKNRKYNGNDGFYEALYNVNKNQSKYRKIEFNISKEEHKNLILQNCHYCGLPPHNTYRNKWLHGELKYNGLDRKDGSKGYTIDNLVTCCIFCNKAKNTMKYEEFIDYINRLIEFNN